MLRPSILRLIRSLCDAAVDHGIALESASLVARLSADGAISPPFPLHTYVLICAAAVNRPALVEVGLIGSLVRLAIRDAEDTRTVCLLVLSEFAEQGMIHGIVTV